MASVATVQTETHEPIAIDSDDDFDLPDVVSRNGVRSGSGTASDPYRISNWTIRPTAGVPAVLIRDTTRHVVFDNVTIVTASPDAAVVAGRVRHVTLQGLDVGGAGGDVVVVDSQDVSIGRSILNRGSIQVSESAGVSIDRNQLGQGRIGATVTGPINIMRNHVHASQGIGIHANGIGAETGYPLVVTGNRVDGRPFLGISLGVPHGGTVCRNDVLASESAGIFVAGGTGPLEICRNHVENAGVAGLDVLDATGLWMHNNTVRDSDVALSARNTTGLLERNFIVRNQVGVSLISDAHRPVPALRANLLLENAVAASVGEDRVYDLARNYWGSPEDPALRGQRSGTNVLEGRYEYRPWCLDAACLRFSEQEPGAPGLGILAASGAAIAAAFLARRQNTYT